MNRVPASVRGRAFGIAVAALLVGALLPVSVLAAQAWTASADRASVVPAQSTTVTVTVANTSSGNGGGEAIGCITLAIPSQFTVSANAIVSTPPGDTWSISRSGSNPTIVTVVAQGDGDRLKGSPDLDQLVVSVTVTGGATGSYQWTADEFNKPDCSQPWNAPIQIPMAVAAPPNTPPVANPDSYSAAKNLPLIVLGASGVLANDIDADGDPLTASVVTGPTHGILTLGPGGGFTYAPDLGYTGVDTFTYAASDGSAASNALVTISISNTAPVASDDSAGGPHDADVVVAAPGVLGNDTDANGDGLTATLDSGPTSGSVSLASDGSYVYTPATGFVGSASFTYTASDGAATSAPATVVITITNVTPSAADDAWSVVKNHDLVVAAPGVMANDVGGDGDPLTTTVETGPSHGSLALGTDGSFVYAPAPDFTGADSFTYRLSDGIDSSVATVSLDVANDAPVATDDEYATWRNTVLTVAATGLLANDSDANGDALTATLLAGASHGTATVNADGSLRYVPDPGFAGPDSFTYTVSDGTDSATATVWITVSNRVPVATDMTMSVGHDRTLTVTSVCGALCTASDADGDTLTATAATSPAHGSLSLASDGSFSYVPDAGFVGSDAFDVDISDGLATITITITIDVTNAIPVAAGTSVSLVGDGSHFVSAPGLLSGASDADGDSLSIVVTNGPAHGTLVVGSSGSYLYTPDSGFAGTDSFTFVVSDGFTTSAAAVVNLLIAGPPITPGPTLEPTPVPTATPEPTPVPTATPEVSPTPTIPPGPIATPPAGGDAFLIPGAQEGGGGSAGFADVGLAASLIGGLGLLLWAVPAAAGIVGPGLLIVLLTILAQTGGGLAWLPILRRRIGSGSAAPSPSGPRAPA